MVEPKLVFEDVKKCKSTHDFSMFVWKYLGERGLSYVGEHGELDSTYSALCFAWKEAWVLSVKPEPKLIFEDVAECEDVAEFNLFVRGYLAERGFVADGLHGDTSSMYWALFHKWVG